MRRNQRSLLLLQGSLFWLGISILALLTLSSALLGQASRDSATSGHAISDWSNHHVVFSKPATAERAARVEQDPRYWQQIRSQSPALPTAATSRMETERLIAPETIRSHHPGREQESEGLWLADMGTGATVGAGNYPAKFSLNVNPAAFSCTSDFVVYSTGLPGTGTQASLVAYNNLYSGCGGSGPSVYFAYDTFATVTTSPVFWYDGTQLAVAQQNAAGHGVLMLLKWKAAPTETIAAPGRPRNIRPGLYTSCPAPCKTLFFLEDVIDDVNTAASDTNSSVFYDYGHDTAYVGDDLGYLHKFNPVFEGTPAEVTTGGWPVLVSQTVPATPLTSPVHDSVTGNVFVEDKGGFLYSVNSTIPFPIPVQSTQLDFSVNDTPSGPGFVQGPIVDSSAGFVYVFATSDGSGGCTGGADCSAVYQFTTILAPDDLGTEAEVGNSSVEPTAPSPMYVGAFDNAYRTSGDATGNLYVCGNTGGSPTIFQIPIRAGTMEEVNQGASLSTSTTACSPVSDVYNPNVTGGATEWLFASAQTGGVPTNCASGGCVMNFVDTAWLAATTYSPGQEILDNKLHIEVVKTGGTSGLTEPGWNGAVGGATSDPVGPGGVTWIDQGPETAVIPPAWAPHTVYAAHTKILDGSNNIEYVTTAGTSGASVTFNPAPGGATTDNTVHWENLGAIATANMSSAGGTSGIIIDNTVSTITEAGTSQIYFSTLGSQACGTSGTGGCAVQASQSALK
jgi:hypothetical protein